MLSLFARHTLPIKKPLCSGHDKFITCDWSASQPPSPLPGLTNDRPELVWNLNCMIDIVPRSEGKKRSVRYFDYICTELIVGDRDERAIGGERNGQAHNKVL